MKLAIDVYYYENQAKTVGILFKDWRSEKEEQILVSYSHEILPYEPGNFYKRELPCIIDLLNNIDLNLIEEIIIDGYVYLDDKGKPGLGYYLYEYLLQEKPVIGVAKNAFHKNSNNYVKEIYRGESIKPLYVTSAGLDLEISAENIRNMFGKYRIPYLFSLLDQETKKNKNSKSLK